MRLEKDFEEFIGLLNKHKVRYLVVGAYAVSFYARPRYTGDIDFLIEGTPGNSKRLLACLKEFGFGELGLRVEDFEDPEMVVQLGYEPVRIDILSSLSGVETKEALRSRVQGSFGRQKAWFISLVDLIQSKRATGRKQDEADVEHLQKIQRRGTIRRKSGGAV